MARATNANRAAAIEAGYTPGTKSYNSYMRNLQRYAASEGKQTRNPTAASLAKLSTATGERYSKAAATRRAGGAARSSLPARPAGNAAGVQIGAVPRAAKITGVYKIAGDRRSASTVRTVEVQIGSTGNFERFKNNVVKYTADDMGLDYDPYGYDEGDSDGDNSDGALAGIAGMAVSYVW